MASAELSRRVENVVGYPPLFEDAEVAPRPAPTLVAKAGETPPLRPIEVPAKKVANSVQ